MPRSPTRPNPMPTGGSPPAPRPLAGAQVLRRAREAMVERAALGGLALLALTVGGFAGHAILTRAGDSYDVRAVLPSRAGPFAWKKSLADGRRADPDLDPLTTGALPERPARPAASAAPDRASAAADSDYALRQVSGGIALVEGRDGPRQVAVGSALPGAGRVLSIRNTGAGWVVITTETIIGPERL